jgi:hypothetical protein
MEIAEARTLTPDELAVDDKAVNEAEATARDAAELHAALKRQVVEAGTFDKSKAVPVLEAAQIAEFHADRADRIRGERDRAVAGQRLQALDAVAGDVKKTHDAVSAPDAAMAEGLKMMAEGGAMVDRAVGVHNTGTSGLIGRARELGAEPPAPSGPRASSAHVAVKRDSIQAGNMVIQMVAATTVAAAKEMAIKGDAVGALARLHAAQTVAPPRRADHYYVTGGGMVHAQDDGQRRDGSQINTWPAKVAKGEARELDPHEVELHLDGRFDGHTVQA